MAFEKLTRTLTIENSSLLLFPPSLHHAACLLPCRPAGLLAITLLTLIRKGSPTHSQSVARTLAAPGKVCVDIVCMGGGNEVCIGLQSLRKGLADLLLCGAEGL